MTYWVNAVCLDHAEIGVRDGIVQADHGKPQRISRLAQGDGIVIYSPRTSMRSRTPVQAFTALGYVADDECYQVELREGFHPWRRDVDWVATRHAPVREMIPRLSFLPAGRSWGLPFRRGLFSVPESDFEVIREAMLRSGAPAEVANAARATGGWSPPASRSG